LLFGIANNIRLQPAILPAWFVPRVTPVAQDSDARANNRLSTTPSTSASISVLKNTVADRMTPSSWKESAEKTSDEIEGRLVELLFGIANNIRLQPAILPAWFVLHGEHSPPTDKTEGTRPSW
jgi:hypothetical protein